MNRYWFLGVEPKTKDFIVIKDLVNLFLEEKEKKQKISYFLELYHLCDSKTFLAIWNHLRKEKLVEESFDIKNIVEYSVIIGKHNEKYRYVTLYEYFPRNVDAQVILKTYKRTKLFIHFVHEAIFENDMDTLQELSGFLLLMPCYQWVIDTFLPLSSDHLKSEKLLLSKTNQKL